MKIHLINGTIISTITDQSNIIYQLENSLKQYITVAKQSSYSDGITKSIIMKKAILQIDLIEEPTKTVTWVKGIKEGSIT